MTCEILSLPTADRHFDKKVKCIPANFFWDISVRFLSSECYDFWRRLDHFRRFPKKSKVVRSLPKTSKVFRSLRTRINASLLPVLFTSKIRDHEEDVVIYSFYTWFTLLSWVRVNMARWQQVTFFNQAWEIGPQAWAGVRLKFSTRRHETHA